MDGVHYKIWPIKYHGIKITTKRAREVNLTQIIWYFFSNLYMKETYWNCLSVLMMCIGLCMPCREKN